MEFKDRLTNEDLRKKFKSQSQFDLVRYAIELAENMIASGREPRMKTDVKNRAMQILEEISTGQDKLDVIAAPSMPIVESLGGSYEGKRDGHAHREERPTRNKKAFQDVVTKAPVQKRSRKILAD